MTALVLSAAEYTELVRQHHTNPEGPVVLTSRGDEVPHAPPCQRHEQAGLVGSCFCPKLVAPSRWATSSPTTCPECFGHGQMYHAIEWDQATGKVFQQELRPCPACGGSGATRTIELRTTCEACDGEGQKMIWPWPKVFSAIDHCKSCEGDGTVLVGRAASCETVPVVGDSTSQENPRVWLWSNGSLLYARNGEVPVWLPRPDPLPSPGDYALIITDYETRDTRHTEHTQTGERA